MPAPDTLVTQAELERAITLEKLRQLLPAAGKKEPDTERVLLALRSGTGAVLGPVAKAIQPASLDVWWDAPTTAERDKAELKRLGLSASIYYAHFYGLKAEEIPDALLTEMERAEKRAMEIGDHYATLGSKNNPAAATQNEWLYGQGAGHYPEGSGRKNWSNF
jgi:hypothetical protein